MAISEEEEFEFRLRMEREQAAQAPVAPRVTVDPSKGMPSETLTNLAGLAAGGEKGLTANWADELLAAPGIARLAGLEGKTYADRVREARGLIGGAARAAPKSAFAGELAGGAVPFAGALAATGGSLPLAGALYGTAAGAGEGETLEDRLRGGAVGGGAGLITGAAAEPAGALLGRGATFAGEKLRRLGGDIGLRRLGVRGLDVLGSESERAVAGRTAMEQGLVPMFGSTKGGAERAVAAKEAAGQRVGDILNIAERTGAGKVDPVALWSDFISRREASKLAGSPAATAEFERIAKEIMAKAPGGQPMTVGEAQNLKEILSKMGYSELTGTEKMGRALSREARASVNAALEGAVAKSTHPSAAGYRAAKELYDPLMEIASQAPEKAQRVAERGIKQYIPTLHEPIPAGAMDIGEQAFAKPIYQAGKAVGAVGRLQGTRYGSMLSEAATRSGPAGIAVTNHMLMQTDPEYRKLMLAEGQEQQ